MFCDVVRGSHLDTFDMCKYRYLLLCEERRTPDILVHNWAQLGWLMHKTLQEALDSGENVFKVWEKNLKNRKLIVEEEVRGCWPDVDYDFSHIPPFTQTQGQRAGIMLLNWHRVKEGLFPDRASIETEVKFALDMPNNAKYVGTIDVRTVSGDTGMILDYKSSQPNWEHKKIPFQIYRYAMATSLLSPVELKKIEMVIFNLQSGNLVHETYYPQKMDQEVLKQVVQKIEQIRKTEKSCAFHSKGSHCRTLCEYGRKTCVYGR